MSKFVYLASKSPRRQELLGQLGIGFKMLLADPGEDTEHLENVTAAESARHYVQRVVVLKAGAAVLRRRKRALSRAPILAADTTVALGRAILGKPDGPNDAARMLALLSGKTHRVLTAVAVTDGQRLNLALSESKVTLRVLTKVEIRTYIESQEPFGKAGSYAIQGRAGAFVAHLSGSFSGVMGLPLFETSQLLRDFKLRF